MPSSATVLLFGITAIAIFFACCGRGSGELRLKENKQHIFLLGILQAGTMLSYFTSVKHTTVAIAVLLLYTAPIYGTLLSPIPLNEPMPCASYPRSHCHSQESSS